VVGVRLTRDSVALSDDVWAPHEWQFPVQEGTTLGELIQIAIDEHYLANVTVRPRRVGRRGRPTTGDAARGGGPTVATAWLAG
jgi:hypothetical protein